jgi:hypothetical protein
MRATDHAGEQRHRTFTEAARRAQIVEAAIDIVAEVGVRQCQCDMADFMPGIELGCGDFRELIVPIVDQAGLPA